MNRFFYYFLLITMSFVGQELPPINTYTTKIYKGENQNWDISQANNKFIYAANNKGLLEFNGSDWQLYPTPNKTIMRSVKVVKDKIYTGFYMDFGFWKKNKFGELKFTSIVKEQNIQMLEDEQIWTILESDGWVLFRSLERIYLYNLETKEVKVISPSNKLLKLSKVNDVIYFQEIGQGVFEIENGVPKLISDHHILKDNMIVEVFSKNGKLLFLTQKKGFFYLNGKELLKWKIKAESLLEKVTVYSARLLKNKDFALGTISDGFIYLNKNGSINYQIKQSSGLNNNTVLSVFEDIENNIWLGLDNGINAININSPFRIYNKKNDFIGTVYSSIAFDGNLYLGTNQGLFYKQKDSRSDFKLIENTQGQVWSLDIINNTLFCGHDSGTFLIENNKSTLIFNEQGTWKLKEIDDSNIIQGCYDGLYILEKKNNSWALKNKVAGFNNSSKDFVKYDHNKFFVNHEYKGVFKLTLDKEFKKVVSMSKEESLAKGLHTCLISHQDKILYSSKNGVFLYDRKKDFFVKDSIYSKLISKDGFISGKLAFNKANNILWSFSKDNIKYLIQGKLTNKPVLRSIPVSVSMPRATYGYENVMHIENDKYLIGTSNGYVAIDLNKLKNPTAFKIQINKANNFILDKPKTSLNLSLKQEFSSYENNFEFFYSVPNYNKITNIKYQYRLLGKSMHWSSPSDSKSVLFENVSYGSYIFKVRAIVGGEISANEASFSFNIKRPWYLSNSLMIIYILLSLSALYLVHIVSKRNYKKQKEELLVKAQKELELKDLESSQQIIKLNNDKLRSNIESKNRELAISTMNMIKKNDFLNTIKVELINGGDKNISKVVKIIDKNLNNTDDWKMFQEAFNNADKNFLKKVKDRHVSLTPNDLRLCAYLRLNLSSKEIAPLFNISPRSVEVKRYRLRKKMDLPHDSNLTNYILEI